MNKKRFNIIVGLIGLIGSVVFAISPVFTLGAIIGEASGEASNSTDVDMVFRVIAIIIIVLTIILFVKVRETSFVGKVFLLIGALVVAIVSSLFGLVGGILGIIGAALILSSTKKIS